MRGAVQLRRIGCGALAAGMLTLVIVGAPVPSDAQDTEARVVPWDQARATIESFRVTDGGGASLGAADWRVVTGTGNCCENYIATTASGRILDLGGDFLKFSDDLGVSWREVLPPLPPAIGGWEGAVSGAPGGDIVGATWSPYAGDQIVAFKYDAASKRWLSAQTVVHTPFFDRPWLGVIPGPFTVGGQTVPYVSTLTSNFSSEVTYYSVDGLNYFLPNNRQQDEISGSTRSRWLDLSANPYGDWIQPSSFLRIAPLTGGGAVADCCARGRWAIMDPPDLKWSGFTLPQGEVPDGTLVTDSAGALHHVTISTGASSFAYRRSTDGGRNWSAVSVSLPTGYRVDVRGYDLKADAVLGTAVVAVHATQNGSDLDQDLVYEISTAGPTPTVRRVFYLGAGDLAAGSALGGDNRFDFTTVGLLPDGKIVGTFVDRAHQPPALAILVSAPEPSTPDPSPSTSPTTPVDEEPPTITDVSDRPDPFTIRRHRRARCRIDYVLDEDARVTVTIKRKGAMVRSLVDETRSAGSWIDYWDGRGDGGRIVRAGLYRYEIVASDSAGLTGRATGTIRVRRR